MRAFRDRFNVPIPDDRLEDVPFYHPGADSPEVKNPQEPARTSWVAQQLGSGSGPVVVATDYVRAYAEQIRAFVPAGRRYLVLGTDGYGRSDSRANLRR